MSNIPSRMIDIDTTDSRRITLERLLMDQESIPISMWGNPSPYNIEKAIAYLKSVGGGSVRIPATDLYNLLVIRVMWGKDRNIQTPDMVVRYEYMDWRPPINKKDSDGIVLGEYRPYTEMPWQAGDRIQNSDLVHSDDKSVEWYCVASGDVLNPAGTWKSISASSSSSDDSGGGGSGSDPGHDVSTSKFRYSSSSGVLEIF